jgi:spermidine/putrescine transport system substrate-binding protein
MTFHPRERRPGATRRQFLQFSGLAAVATTGALAGCGRERPTPPGQQILLSRPDRPARLPLHPEVPAIASGLKPETGGTFRILNYAEYLSPDVVKAFGEKYGVTVEITTFVTQDEAIAKLQTPGTSFDIHFPTPDVLGRVVAAKLLQPLNHSYVPHLANSWPDLQDPFYDKGSQYSVPYNVYTTGVGYRADRISTVPASGYDLLWDTAHRGKIYVLDDDRETLAMAMRKAGHTDLNTEDPGIIATAAKELDTLVDAVNVKMGISGYQLLPEGQATVHQMWSGEIVNAQYYLPEGVPTSVLGFWYQPDLRGVVGTDTMTIPRSSSKPVLAHAFLDHLLDNDTAFENFSYTGYQPTLSVFTAEKMVADEYVPANLTSAVVTPDHYAKGLQLLQLSPEGEAIWEDYWASFKAGT